ncbi:hypothetical protein PVB08_22360 [Bacillus thuringiensis]
MASNTKNAVATNGNVRPAASSQRPEITEETLKQLLDVQGRELDLRSKELDLRVKEMDTNSSHAEKILNAQERDREAERVHQRSLSKGRYLFVGCALVVLAALIIAGMYLNKDALVKDLIQIVGSGVLGALGGYGYASRKKRPSEPEDS